VIAIRSARGEELRILSDLALRSKAYWGYDADFLEACRSELTLTEDRLQAEAIRVAEEGSSLLGFHSVLVDGEGAELMDLFVDPKYIGYGAGRALWDDVVDIARRRGATRLRIEADPHAEPWYRRRGACGAGRSSTFRLSARPGSSRSRTRSPNDAC
jgi:GNAT superfamily N-acetyltransferase